MPTAPRCASIAPRVVVLLAAVTLVLIATQQIAQAIVTDQVRRDIPIALDGEVWAVEQVGNSVVVGGNFTQVQTERNGPIVTQAGLFAYDLDSGRFIESFRPILTAANGNTVEIRDIEPAADGRSFYIGGRFASIDDRSDGVVRTRNRLALLDVRTGLLDRNFAQAGVDALVLSIDLADDGFLYTGGNFQTVFDLAPGRPPINQQVGGLARFNATTGAFDTSFRYSSQNFIGRSFNGAQTPGVVKVVLNPSENRLFVAHRGGEIFDAVRGTTHDSPGIARLDVSQINNHSVTEYKLLFPDANDPIQDFFHAEQCDGRGVQIRDLAVASGFLVVVSQGADTGAQCDTATRFPTGAGQHRPDWGARAFDSIFSVEIDGDDVYIGGHFRFLVNSTAPSPYPGERAANGEELGAQIYIADPERDDAFREDLVDPGFVFPVGQIGVLDADTGYADPSFTPQSDAFVGVLEITAIERGLLIGQDQGRIDDFFVGRAPFFDNDPSAGQTRCSVTLDGNGDPVISWNEVGSVFQYNVAVDGNYLATIDGSDDQFIHPAAAPNATLTYELRYNRNGLSFTEDCGAVRTPGVTHTCNAVVNGENEVTVSWNDEGWTRVSVFRNGSWRSTDSGTLSYTEEPGAGNFTYVVRAFIGADRTVSTCTPVVVLEAPVLACTESGNGANITLTWNDIGAASYQIRTNNAWVASTPAGSTSFVVPDDGGEHMIRYRMAGQVFDVSCQ